MAKSSGFDSESVREDEREIETRAAGAGRDALNDQGTGSLMPGTMADSSESIAQRAADGARSYNEGSETIVY